MPMFNNYSFLQIILQIVILDLVEYILLKGILNTCISILVFTLLL